MVCLIQKPGKKKKIGAIDIGIGNADSAGASKSLSVRTLCPDYHMPDVPDASGPNVYVVDSLEAMACELIDGYRHDLASIVRLARHTGEVKTTSESPKGSHRMFNFEGRHK
jgi:hypothetical protein